MCNKTISMTRLKLIIQQLSKGCFIKFITQNHNVSRNTIRSYERKNKGIEDEL